MRESGKGGMFLVFFSVEGRGFEFAIWERLQRLLSSFFIHSCFVEGIDVGPTVEVSMIDSPQFGTTEARLQPR